MEIQLSKIDDKGRITLIGRNAKERDNKSGGGGYGGDGEVAVDPRGGE